tara:strand:+ start:2223 stop:2387 length:165 start_codon:yes stop_codon:yes gene_type:complete
MYMKQQLSLFTIPSLSLPLPRIEMDSMKKFKNEHFFIHSLNKKEGRSPEEIVPD